MWADSLKKSTFSKSNPSQTVDLQRITWLHARLNVIPFVLRNRGIAEWCVYGCEIERVDCIDRVECG